MTKPLRSHLELPFPEHSPNAEEVLRVVLDSPHKIKVSIQFSMPDDGELWGKILASAAREIAGIISSHGGVSRKIVLRAIWEGWQNELALPSKAPVARGHRHES